MSISACIICKNEENNITRCLESIKDVVDEIIIVDTGSTDNTINIVKQYTSKIIHYGWDDDFSKARNISLESATSEWILIIDSDEMLTQDSKEEISNLALINENIEGFGVLVTNIIDGCESSVYPQLRIIKNKKNYRFEGIIHEQISDCILKSNPNAIFFKTNINLMHYGYENDEKLKNLKSNRNIHLLSLVKEKDRDGMYYTHLGAEYERINDFKNAFKTFIKGYNITSKSKPYFPQLAHKLVESLLKNNEFEQCILFCEDILKYMPDFRCIYFINAISYLNLNDYKNALKNLQLYKTLDEKPFKYPVINYSEFNNIDAIISSLKRKV